MASTNDITPGLYRIYNAAETGRCLDVNKASTANRAYVYGYAPNYSDAQVWELSYRADGTAQILYRFAGKSLEVYGATSTTVKPGQQLSIFTDNDTDAQQWNLNPTGSTVAISGTSYDTYMIQLDFETAYAATLDTSTSTRPVKLQTPDTTDTKQAWAFVPIEKYRDGGLYEIHSIMDTSMLFDVNGLSKANGANLQLHVPNGGNNQKFVLEAGTGTYAGYWAIRSVYSGKYMHTASNTMKDGVNVHQWQGTATPNAWWKITEYGTKAIKGTDCQVVSFGNKNNTAYLIDAAFAMTKNGTNLMVNQNNQGSNQEWALLPTEATDANLPTPTGLGFAYSVGAAGQAVVKNQTANVYPTWSCADGWMVGANHYQIRFRRRLMSNVPAAWGEWDEWDAWQTAAVTTSGSQCWLTEGVSIEFDTNSYKAQQVEMQVRCCGAAEDGLQNLTGGVADKVISVYVEPKILFVAHTGWSVDGLKVSWASQYFGGTYFYPTAITTTGTSGETKTSAIEGLRFSAQNSTDLYVGSFTIPAEQVEMWPADGSSVTLTYETGVDLYPRWSGANEKTLTVNYDEGSSGSVEPTLEIGEGRLLFASVPHIGTERMWLQLADGSLRELDGEIADGSTTFRVPFPFGAGFALWTSATSSDGATWWTDYTEYSKDDEPMASVKPVHSFMWDGGAVCLELKSKSTNTDTSRTLSPSYSTYELNGRERQAVTFGSTIASKFSVDGILIEGVSEAEAYQFERDLAEAHYVIYRSPNGHVVRAAVTGVDVTWTPYQTKVGVDLVEVEW